MLTNIPRLAISARNVTEARKALRESKGSNGSKAQKRA